MFEAQNRPQNVGVERRSVAVESLLGERAGLALCSSVVHGNIQATEHFDRLVDKSLHIGLLANVGLDEVRLGTEGLQLCDQCSAYVLMPPGEHDACSVLGEGKCCGAADAGEGASNEHGGFGGVSGGHDVDPLAVETSGSATEWYMAVRP